jgi:hypothetical protein
MGGTDEFAAFVLFASQAITAAIAMIAQAKAKNSHPQCQFLHRGPEYAYGAGLPLKSHTPP